MDRQHDSAAPRKHFALTLAAYSKNTTEQFVDTFKRALLKAKQEGTTEEVIRKFLLTYRTIAHPMLDGKAIANDQACYDTEERDKLTCEKS
ncbi:hypothetical protein ACTXT7_003672 [Hymenolepis weldensis]